MAIRAPAGWGPPLNDSYWRYGGSPVEIYKSIYEGRPKGMPAWGVALPPNEIWALTAYVSSLGGGKEASNVDPSARQQFTGIGRKRAQAERRGH